MSGWTFDDDMQDVVAHVQSFDKSGTFPGRFKKYFSLIFVPPVWFFPMLLHCAFSCCIPGHLCATCMGGVGAGLGCIFALPIGIVLVVPALILGLTLAVCGKGKYNSKYLEVEEL